MHCIEKKAYNFDNNEVKVNVGRKEVFLQKINIPYHLQYNKLYVQWEVKDMQSAVKTIQFKNAGWSRRSKQSSYNFHDFSQEFMRFLPWRSLQRNTPVFSDRLFNVYFYFLKNHCYVNNISYFTTHLVFN